MASDLSFNLYDVVKEAEKYFDTIDKSKKGSGWKSYQRWLYENEPKYYPSGNRNLISSNFSVEEFKFFKENNSSLYSKQFENGWDELGPYFIEEVTGHYAVGLGRIESFYIDPNNSDRIFIGSRSGGFWKTLDNGQSWINTTIFCLLRCKYIAITSFKWFYSCRNSHNGTLMEFMSPRWW